MPADVQPDRRFPAWAALAPLPMLLAVLGAALDEHRNLGFSTWRNACRSSGLSLSSLFTFTLDLLPSAVIGALAGGVLLQLLGICLRHRRGVATASLAAHGGCSLGMAAGLPLCVLPVPVSWVLAGEMLLAAVVAMLLRRMLVRGSSCTASGMLPTGTPPSA